MSEKLHLKIITPQKILVDEYVDEIYSKSIDGEFGILAHHVSYMTDLAIGVTEYKKDNKKEFVSTIGGVIQVKDNVVIILSDTAEIGDEIDIPRARAAKERAEARLGTGVSDIDTNRVQISLARAIARMCAAAKRR